MLRPQQRHRLDLATAVARVLCWGRRRPRPLDPSLDDTACSVLTYCGRFRIRSYRVAVRVHAAFGGCLYQPIIGSRP